VAHLKPPKFAHYLTLGELSVKIGRDPSRIRALEREGRLPEAKRAQVGKLPVRLYSPEQVVEIERIFKEMRPGRPRA
jgi:DNA-binding transcriptional MerR regulator